ncbi:MAG: hypothetical protein Kow00129_10740 [Thermoleophilia bacterium]
MTDVYVDTSALAKWYLNEEFSEEVEAFLRRVLPVSISALTKVETKSLFARRRRDGSLPPVTEGKAYSVFEGDIAAGHLVLLPVRVEHYLRSLGGSRSSPRRIEPWPRRSSNSV